MVSRLGLADICYYFIDAFTNTRGGNIARMHVSHYLFCFCLPCALRFPKVNIANWFLMPCAYAELNGSRAICTVPRCMFIVHAPAMSACPLDRCHDLWAKIFN